jgi:uncharacterized protein (DUF1800 family)
MNRKFERCVCVAAGLLLGFSLASVGQAQTIFKSGFDETPEGPATDQEAARFLTQATYGPTIAEIQRLRLMGYNTWLEEQFAMPMSKHKPYLDSLALVLAQLNPPESIYNNHRREVWMQRAMTAPDQLRQRVAFALSEILVTSENSGALEGQPFALAHYYDLLGSGAFGNYRTLLKDVTLHPVMGHYLSMFGNVKPDPGSNQRPDENYAREIMQLFSIGLVQLNPDGTVFDSAPGTAGVQSVPTYTQETITGFAHVFTGWRWFNCPIVANEPWQWMYCGPGTENEGWLQPMAPNVEFHAVEGSKQLLNYSGVALINGSPNGVMPAGNRPTATHQTVRDNLDAALSNIFNHPNVGPFLSKLLIQRLVTSNPTPAYVQRVASKFNNNGATPAVRGDLRAVIRAILMDPEARTQPVSGSATGGKLREQPLRWTQFWRAFNVTIPSGRYEIWFVHWPSHTPVSVLNSPTVFNYYLPNYAAPGPDVAQAGLLSPEFQIETDTFVTRFNNHMEWLASNLHAGNTGLEAEYPRVNYAREVAMAGNVNQLLDHLNVLLMGGTMSTSMRSTLSTYLNSVPVGDYDDFRRVTDAVSLIITSPEYLIEK